jgi:microcystin-dependent protein
MDGTMSEIRMYAPNFAPKHWALCAGQLLAISTNQALFALLGTTFGGNGTSNFGLPDLRGRVAIGTGSTSGLTPRAHGEVGGTEVVTLLLNQMPQHTHNSTLSGSGKMSVSSAAASLTTPVAGATIARPIKATGRSSTPLLGFNNAQPNVALSNATLDTGTLTVTNTAIGSNLPHSNMQPYLGINYIICLQGVFPSRN